MEDRVLEIKEKVVRIRGRLDKENYDVAVVTRQDNFSWLTCGGSNLVVISSEMGFASLVVDRERVLLVAQSMDAQRMIDEQLGGLTVECVSLRWDEESPAEWIEKYIRNKRVVSDSFFQGARVDVNFFYALHFPLTVAEIAKCRWIGTKTEEAIRTVADELKPGLSELDVKAMLMYELAKCDMFPEVVLVGSDERIKKYRHCIPSENKIGNMVVIHPAARKWGLHANVARMVCLNGKVPEDTKKRFDTARRLLCAALAMCKKGARFADIHQRMGRLFEEYGYKDEFFKHYIGGTAAYFLCRGDVCFDPDAIVENSQAYDWFITITGAKVEELGIFTNGKIEVASLCGKWPSEDCEFEGVVLPMPQILIKN